MIHQPLTRRAFAVASAASAAALAAPATWAQSGTISLDRVTVAVGGPGGLSHLPVILADQLGYFRAEGLHVTVRDYATEAAALQAVQTGAADVCSAAFDHSIRLQQQGLAYRSLVLQGRAPQLALGVSMPALPGYRELSDLAGRRIGVSTRGSATEMVASLLLARVGLGPRDVTFVGLGSELSALAAVRSGQVQAVCHADPVMTLLEQRHELRIVGDVRTLSGAQSLFGGDMPSACVLAPQEYIQKYGGRCQALVYGVVHALKWLQTAAATDLVKVIPAAFLMGDRGAYLAAFHRVRETYSPHGMMPDEGPATALRALTRVDPELARARIDLGRTFSNDWTRKARLKYGV